MARPQAEILHTQEDDAGSVWRVLAAPAIYIMTYQGQPFNLVTESRMGDQPKKYKKTSYATEGSARARARELNALFHTEAFAYQRVGIQE